MSLELRPVPKGLCQIGTPSWGAEDPELLGWLLRSPPPHLIPGMFLSHRPCLFVQADRAGFSGLWLGTGKVHYSAGLSWMSLEPQPGPGVGGGKGECTGGWHSVCHQAAAPISLPAW